jgi:OmpA-OmpF porin, OOP family
MGKILRTTKLTTFSELLIVIGGIGAILGAVYFISPGIKTAVSKQLTGIELNTTDVNNITNAEKIALKRNFKCSKRQTYSANSRICMEC